MSRLSCARCAKRLSRPTKLGFCLTCRNAHRQERNVQMAAMRREGIKPATIALLFGVSENVVYCATAKYMPTVVRAATMADIIAEAAEISNVLRRDLTGRGRHAALVRIRHAVCYIGRECGLSFPIIARALGRDHSTVIHGRDKCAGWMAEDREYAALVERIMVAAKSRKPLSPALPEPVPAPEPIRPALSIVAQPEVPEEELDDIELLSRAVAQHYARAA